jgi:glycosyltransferase involved in cell wall biosynthesis
MRIAQVAPLYESVPPKLYGGTERVVAYLTDQLVRMGHEVTLLASADSCTTATLVGCCERATRLDPDCVDDVAPHVLQLERVVALAARFDVIHFHGTYLHLLAAPRFATPHVTTLHGRLDLPHLAPMFRAYRDAPLVSISEAQRHALPHAAWYGTVHHGLPRDLHRCVETPGDYFVFVGRISPEKGIEHAIEIARRLDVPLKIAAKVSREDECYFRTTVEPLLRHRLIEFLGEVDEHRKGALLGGARALLFPIAWPEPFGLVMIEAMACGTPVVAFGCGSVPELIDDGVTGFVVSDLEEAVQAAQCIHTIDRRRCRDVFEQRFSSERMAANYLAIYQELTNTRTSQMRSSRANVYAVPTRTAGTG